jgi:hypothetical protein
VKKAAAANLRTSLLRPIKDGKMEFKAYFRRQWMVLLDGSALDKKARYHPPTGTIIGSCEHVPVGIKLNLSIPADGAAVLAALKEGQENPDSCWRSCTSSSLWVTGVGSPTIWGRRRWRR